MWKTTYHNGSLPDVKCYGHSTSPLVTSAGTRCEKSISTDVKCHFCSSDLSLRVDTNLEKYYSSRDKNYNRDATQQKKKCKSDHKVCMQF
jgi:hypothetical protein